MSICSIDFFIIPTTSFNIMFVLVILCHSRRKVVHFNVSHKSDGRVDSPTGCGGLPLGYGTKVFDVGDRDEIYGVFFRNRVKKMGIKEVISAPQSPWENPFVERVIGSIRRECTDHVIVLNQGHLKNILCAYFEYFHNDKHI